VDGNISSSSRCSSGCSASRKDQKKNLERVGREEVVRELVGGVHRGPLLQFVTLRAPQDGRKLPREIVRVEEARVEPESARRRELFFLFWRRVNVTVLEYVSIRQHALLSCSVGIPDGGNCCATSP
jgi:hypothetical protein